MYNFIRQITEGRLGKTLERVKLPYPIDGLGKSLSKQTLDYHYGKLYKAYCDRYNAGEGDPDFNEAGAYLHSIFFSQFKRPGVSRPHGAILDIINRHHTNWIDFKKNFKEEALKLQGSSWIYLSKSGQIKTIKNHAIRQDIAILVDMWEHAFVLDHLWNKEAYIDSFWKIVDWGVVNERL
mgnify:CR=1 FL=1